MKCDQIEFTRNDRTQSRENGGRAQIVSVNTEHQTARIRLDNGKFQTLDLAQSADQHLRHGYVQTAHAAQGRTAERVMIHADSRSAKSRGSENDVCRDFAGEGIGGGLYR